MSSANKKKRGINLQENNKEIGNESDTSNSNSNSSKDDDFIGSVINVDFEASTMTDEDIDGIKKLLKQLFVKSTLNHTELAELLVSQNYIGSVLKQAKVDYMETDSSDDENNDVFGDILCVKQLRNLLQLNKHDFTKSILNDEIGFLLNERFINIPVNIAPPLFKSLLNEIKLENEKQKKFNFKWICLICKTLKNLNDSKEESFVNVEEEIFFKHADYTFLWDVDKQSDSVVSGNWTEKDDKYQSLRRVVFIKEQNFVNIVQEICNTFSE